MNKVLKYKALPLLLVLSLSTTGCFLDGGGKSKKSTPIPDVSMFVSSVADNAIYFWKGTDSIDGDVAPDNILGGESNAQFNNPYGIGYDQKNESLFVGDLNNNAIKIYEDANNVNGDVAPERTLSGANTLIVGTNAYETLVDSKRDILYIAAEEGIFVYDNASSLDGNAAPARQVTGANTEFSAGRDKRLALDVKNDRLYVSDSEQVVIFNNASTMDGNIAPSRLVTCDCISFLWGIALDTRKDILYLGDESNSEIYSFDNASTINGHLTADRTLSGENTLLNSPVDIEVDPFRDHLYVPNYVYNLGEDSDLAAVSIWEDASSADGNVAPDRIVTGLNTVFSSVEDIVLVFTPK